MNSQQSIRRLRLLIGLTTLATVYASLARERVLLDDAWRFHRGEAADSAQAPAFDDSHWQDIHLPHDWSIAEASDPENPSGGGGGFFATGTGWYRKSFLVPEVWETQRISVEFEGVYQNAAVWINGEFLGMHPYGYTPFSHDVTRHLKFGQTNTLAVRVDNGAQPNCRWYSGSGIYRHVWLHVTDPVHVTSRGVFISTTELSPEAATVTVQTEVRVQTEKSPRLEVETELLAPDGRALAMIRSNEEPGTNGVCITSHRLRVSRPRVWCPDDPAMYTAVTRVFADERQTDETRTPFGIRTVSVSAEHGFELNGQPVLLVGGNVHHDNGPLGAAAFDRAEERRVEILKQAGFNAIRTAHNPPSTAFLDACDRLGMLVMDEAFDGWAKPKTRYDYSTVFRDRWAEDLEAMVLRDRNHPSVVFWSIGNEVYERGDPVAVEIAQEMRERILELDTTRPITAGLNGLGAPDRWPRLDSLFAQLDVAGYNYEEARHAADHERRPSRIITLTESYQSATFGCWTVVHDHPYVIGDFVWSALDYLGEAGIGRVFPPSEQVIPHWEGFHYPWHGAACGDIDITGWRKPISHYRNIVWDRGETLYLTVLEPTPTGDPWNLSLWSMPPSSPNWTWPGHEGTSLQVEVYSRHESVRLFLNNDLIAEQPTSRDRQFKALFNVPYQPGTLRAVGVDDGRPTADFLVRTAGAPKKISMTPDRKRIRADGQDLSFVTVEVVDGRNNLRIDDQRAVQFDVSGPGVIAGIGSGDLTAPQSYQANPRRVHAGRALVVIRSTGEPGRITLRAKAPGLRSARTIIRSK